jgi:ribonuclease HII
VTVVSDRRASRRLATLLTRERTLWATGVERIAGVDEAGVGPLAGPVVAAAVVFHPGEGLLGVDDSKKLTPEQRVVLALSIRESAVSWAVAIAEPDEIDRINVYHASLAAMSRALDGLSVRPQHVLVDARRIPGCDLPQEAIVKGDAHCHAIAAASILAKTTRDALMAELDLAHPGYGFARHKGYPTAEHFDALKRLGACPIHRRSFQPVRVALGLAPAQGELFAATADESDI